MLSIFVQNTSPVDHDQCILANKIDFGSNYLMCGSRKYLYLTHEDHGKCQYGRASEIKTNIFKVQPLHTELINASHVQKNSYQSIEATHFTIKNFVFTR